MERKALSCRITKDLFSMSRAKTGIKKTLQVVFLLTCSFGLLVYNGQASNRIKIITSVFPLAEFAKAVSGERGEVSLLIPPGAEIHAWQPRPSDIVRLSSANLFIFIGVNMEPWLDEVLKGIKNPGLRVLQARQELSLMRRESIDLQEEHEHKPATMDPHIWLDFAYDQIIIDRITTALSELDPEGSLVYQQNASSYKEKLRKLDQKYQENLRDCLQRTFILGGHAAFGYLARRYNLQQVSLYGVSPDSRPTPKKLIEVVEYAREHKIKVIYFEAYVSDELAKVLAKEVDARILALNPGANLTNEEVRLGVTFFDIMEENLRNLKDGLNCR